MRLVTICSVLALMVATPAVAQPVITRYQRDEIIHINQVENGRNRHSDNYGHGNCVLIAKLKRLALIRAGIPPEALHLRVVQSPPGWSDPYHMLLDVDVVVDGRRWSVALDLHDPWPISPGGEYGRGYRPDRSDHSRLTDDE